MSQDALKLTTYCGERDRAGGTFVADALVELYARHALRTSAVFRGVEGFGAHHRLQTDRLLTLSEDLPLVAVAVDRRERIEALLPAVRALGPHGLVTLERARLLGGPGPEPDPGAGSSKLTVYVGRQERAAGRPAPEAVVALLHAHGLAGATALLGVDGTAHGVRRRASLAGRNAEVPAMVISVGDARRVAAVLPELARLLTNPIVTLERVTVLRRDGARLAEPPGDAPPGAGLWPKLTVFAGEQARHGGVPLHGALIARLRAEGAAGATCLRGFWGYHGDHAPHGDRFWALRRHVPVVTVLIDRPEAMRRWRAIVEEVTSQTGLVTSELVRVPEGFAAAIGGNRAD
jgi:PII-like signaling protein